MDPIQSGDILTDEQSRDVRAALALEGSNLQRFASDKGVSYSRLTRIVRSVEAPSAKYVRILNNLVKRELAPRRRIAA